MTNDDTRPDPTSDWAKRVDDTVTDHVAATSPSNPNHPVRFGVPVDDRLSYSRAEREGMGGIPPADPAPGTDAWHLRADAADIDEDRAAPVIVRIGDEGVREVGADDATSDPTTYRGDPFSPDYVSPSTWHPSPGATAEPAFAPVPESTRVDSAADITPARITDGAVTAVAVSDAPADVPAAPVVAEAAIPDNPPDLPPTDDEGYEREPILIRAIATIVAAWVLNTIVTWIGSTGFTLPLPDGVDGSTVQSFVIPALAVAFLAGWARLKAWAPASVHALAKEMYEAGVRGITRPSIRGR